MLKSGTGFCVLLSVVFLVSSPVCRVSTAKEQASIPVEMRLWLSREPCLGETVEVIFIITPSENVPEMRVAFELIRGAEWGGGDTVFESTSAKGETREFRARVRFVSSPASVRAEAKGHAVASDGRRHPLNTGRSLSVMTIDEETGRLGSVQQKLASGPEYRYDMMRGVIYPSGQYYGTGPAAREMIEKLKKLEPQLTDWEAVYLHRDALRAYERGIGRGDERAEDERIRWFLEEGWLEKQREGEEVKYKWLEKLFEQKLQEQEDSELKSGPITEDEVASQSREPLRPKLIWEKEFDRDIFAVGIDEECFDLRKQNITSCLKWILLYGGEVRLVDAVSAGTAVDTTKIVGAEISENTMYFMALKWMHSGRSHYRLYDWDGRLMWRTKNLTPDPHWILNDGSSLFVKFRPCQPRFCEPATELEEVRFYGKNGWLRWKQTFPEGENIAGLSVSGSHIALTTYGPRILYIVDERGELVKEWASLYVFDKWGELDWVRSRIQLKWVSPGGQEERFFPKGVVTTDRGEVLLVLQRTGSSRILVYDSGGTLKDTLKLEHTGQVNSLRTDGKLAFASIGRPPGGLNRLLCYDFEEYKTRFVVEERNRTFQDLDVEAEAELAAVVANESDTLSAIMVYDFEGNYKSQVKFSSASYRKPWFRLLGKALLLAEKNKLKLYALKTGRGG